VNTKTLVIGLYNNDGINIPCVVKGDSCSYERPAHHVGRSRNGMDSRNEQRQRSDAMQ